MRILRFLGIFAAGILSAAIITTAYGVGPTPTPTPPHVPAADLHARKIASGPTDIGGRVAYVIDVTNIGDQDSGSQTLQDNGLELSVRWSIESDSWGCTLSPYTGVTQQFLDCGPAIVAAQSKDGIPGVIQVTLAGQSTKCGAFSNVAFLNLFQPVGPAVATVNCPATPTPSPTLVATSTPTPVVTNTPVGPTATPIQIVVTATPTNTRVAPAPPNTGNTPPEARSHDGLWFLAIFIIPGAILAAYGLLMRRRQ